MLLMLLMLMILMCEVWIQNNNPWQECYLVAKDGVVAQAEKAKRPQPWEDNLVSGLFIISYIIHITLFFLRDRLQKAFPPVIDCDQHHILGHQIVRSINSTCTWPWEREDSHLFKKLFYSFPETQMKKSLAKSSRPAKKPPPCIKTITGLRVARSGA